CFTEGVSLCANVLMGYLTSKPTRDVVHWMSFRQVAEERGNATAKEKVLLPILACHFKEDTRTLFHILGGTCFVITEHQRMYNDPVPFLEAVCLQFATFYVLNLSYPKEASATLEFIQR
ncbi:hypothetical protein HPB47_006628, partial [Ixodes persulcatus]